MLRTELVRPLPELLRIQAETHAGKAAFSDVRRSVTYKELGPARGGWPDTSRRSGSRPVTVR